VADWGLSCGWGWLASPLEVGLSFLPELLLLCMYGRPSVKGREEREDQEPFKMLRTALSSTYSRNV
jgi:hypothetical protein